MLNLTNQPIYPTVNGISKVKLWLAKELSILSEQKTMMFTRDKNKKVVREIMLEVARSMREKGYNPVDQLAGYLMSGDPTYITSYKDARSKLREVERYELLEELLIAYLQERK